MKNLFSKVILMVLLVTMTISVGMTVNAMEYPDDGYWANEAIDAAVANGLLHGKGNGYIDSESNLTRAEMAAIMVRAFGASVKADARQFVDLAPSAWYYDEFAKAIQMKVFEGDGSGYMHPNDNITREEVFTVVARAMVLSDTDHSSLNKFGDADQISDWAKDYMSILTKKSYVNGDNLGNANPKAYITRAEFAQIMYNIFKTYYLNTGSYSDKVYDACVMINAETVDFKNVVVKGDLVIGDGANLSTIKLTNVTIEGRLLVRGSARIELKNTTVGEMVVVNNYNSVVHFDNYRSEKVFNGIILNTKATFKKIRSGGGSTGGDVTTTYVTVTFINEEGVTVDTVELKKGNSMSDEGKSMPSYTKSADGYVKNSEISDLYVGDKEFTHVVNWNWYIKPSVTEPLTKDWKKFTVDTKVEEDIQVLLRVKEFTADVFVKKLDDGFPFATYYEPTTRFADTLKDILSNRVILDALKASDYWDNTVQKLENYNLIDADKNIKIQSIMVRFSDILGGKDKTRDFIIKTSMKSFIDGGNDELEKAFKAYIIDAVGSSDADYVSDTKGLMVKAFEHIIDEAIAEHRDDLLNKLEALAHTIMEDPAAFNEITDGAYDYDSLTPDQRDSIIDQVVVKLETKSTERDQIVSTLVNYLFNGNHGTELDALVHYANIYLSEHEDELELLIEKIYGDDIDNLVEQLIDKDTEEFRIDGRIKFVAEGLKKEIENNYKYEDYIGSKIPERLKKIFEIYPEQKIKDIYNEAIINLEKDIDDALNDVKTTGEGFVACGITVVVDPIADVYSPLYDGVVEFIKNKDVFCYGNTDGDNIYLPEFIELLSPDSLFENAGNKSNTLTGYRIKLLDDYYNLLVKLVILGDDALVWYAGNSTADEFERITDNYQQLILKYVDVAADKSEAKRS